MRPHLVRLCLVGVVAFLAVSAQAPAQVRRQPLPPTNPNRLRELGVALDDAALAEFLRSHWTVLDAKEVPDLICRLGDEDLAVRDKASERLRIAGRAAIALLQEASKSTDREVAMRARLLVAAWEKREVATKAALRLLTERAAVASLRPLIDLKDQKGRFQVIDALKTIGKPAEPCLPDLVEALADADRDTHKLILEALREMQDERHLEFFVRAAKDKRTPVRAGATNRLAKYGNRPEIIGPLVLDAFRDPQPEVRREAASMSWLFREYPGMVAAMTEALRDKDDPRDGWNRSVASCAASAFLWLGRLAEPGLPTLIDVARSSPDEAIQRPALNSLAALGEAGDDFASRIRPVLIEKLQQKDAAPFVRAEAAIGLSRLKHPESAVPALRSVLQEEIPKEEVSIIIKSNILHALERFGREANEAVPEVTAIARGASVPAKLRDRAASTLRIITAR